VECEPDKFHKTHDPFKWRIGIYARYKNSGFSLYESRDHWFIKTGFVSASKLCAILLSIL